MSMESIPHFFGYEVTSLVRSNIVYNTMMIDKAFSKSMDGNFRRNMMCNEGKLIPKIINQ